ncbi:oligosaccharide:H+ symporter [Bacillus mesophilus]|uniref:MFS transporter n=1 Tax=Bacillus mesophilus TaxID=1808955 RepID=A0A6M0QCT1_9BACI|nr:MFS transporter [Bacillus mesophilus]MBM7663487.1 oligosaccharide:H+ symporter [Bacillus mesophilus]NEY74164.1 MFS transporter [Bacillus mesophilus]
MKTTASLKSFLFFVQATGFICTSYLPLYLLSKGYTPSEVGLLLAIGPFAAIISEPMSGYFSDKFKSIKKVLIVCVIGMLVSGIILFQLDHFAATALFVYCLFFFLAPSGSLGDSLSQKTADQLHVSFGSIRMWGSLGFGIASIITGYLLTRIGIENITVPFVFFTVIVLIISFFLKDVKVKSENSDPGVSIKDVALLIRNKPFVLFLLIVILITLGHRANDIYLSVFIKELGGTETLIGWAFFWGVATEVLVFFTSHLWFRKLKDLTFIILAAVLYAVRFIGMSFATSPHELVIYQLFHGFTFGIFFTVGLSYVTKIVPTRLQSTGHLLLITVFFGISGMVSAFIGGRLIEFYSVFTLYFLIGIASLVGALLLMIYKYFIKSEEKTERHLVEG